MNYFLSPTESHEHSLETLTVLNQYQDLMDNIKTVADMGCGQGLDATWWAGLHDINGRNRNIKVNAIDTALDPGMTMQHPSIQYHTVDFSQTGLGSNSQNLIWAHNSLQYSLSPISTLMHWWDLLTVDGMLVVTLPFNFYVNTHNEHQNVSSVYTNGNYFNWTMGNLIIALAATGFDCRQAHFKIDKQRGWLHASVYKLAATPNPQANWYDLCEKKVLPLCIEEAILKNGTFRDSDIVVNWIDRSQYILNL
jgi:hypothetical protein